MLNGMVIATKSHRSFDLHGASGDSNLSGRQEGDWDLQRRRYRTKSKNTYDHKRGHQGKTQKPRAGTTLLRDTWQGDALYGMSPVLSAIDANRRQIYSMYVQEGLFDRVSKKKKDMGELELAVSKVAELGIPVHTVSKHDLNMISDNRPHQGVVLDASELACEKLDFMPTFINADGSNKRWPVWLVLDEITDPQNLGAALRSAYFLGASGVLLCSKNSAPLSGVVSKASAGALEKMAIHSCRSLPNTLADARSKGWSVLGAAADERAISCSEYKVSRPTILVMGSEGYGLRTTVRRACDESICIPGSHDLRTLRGHKDLHSVDSLNVSVATGILLHSLILSASRI
eukprot:jgi/Picsp_1/3625/NSC_06462-R1_rrna methylase family protein